MQQIFSGFHTVMFGDFVQLSPVKCASKNDVVIKTANNKFTIERTKNKTITQKIINCQYIGFCQIVKNRTEQNTKETVVEL